jgi:hypothetical protein
MDGVIPPPPQHTFTARCLTGFKNKIPNVIPAIRVQTRPKLGLVHKNNTKILHTERMRMRASRCASKCVPQQTRSRQSWVSRNHYRVTVSEADTSQHLGKHNHADTDQHDWHTALLVSVLLLTHGRINPRRHVTRANKVRTVVPNRYFLVLSMELGLCNPSEA